MTNMMLLVIGLLLGGLGVAQAQQEGVMPSWEVIELSEALVENATSVQTILEQVRPKEWLQDGAPDAYVTQLEGLRSDLTNLDLSAQALARKPEKLSLVIDTFLWLDRFESVLSSMNAGVRRYQNASLADLLDAASGENIAAVSKLKEYMRQLAVERESEMEIAHNEAQRCRSALANQPQARD